MCKYLPCSAANKKPLARKSEQILGAKNSKPICFAHKRAENATWESNCPDTDAIHLKNASRNIDRLVGAGCFPAKCKAGARG
jgi:hypothetical protein